MSRWTSDQEKAITTSGTTINTYLFYKGDVK